MARKPTKAVRLPGGQYAYRGRAVSFSKIPKAEQHRFRSLWAVKAAKVRAQERAIETRPVKAEKGERSKARDWIKRRSKRVEQQIEHSNKYRRKPLPLPDDPKAILAKLGPKAILAARELQQAAHKAYKGKPGGRALELANVIRDSLGRELAASMPQLWWYH